MRGADLFGYGRSIPLDVLNDIGLTRRSGGRRHVRRDMFDYPFGCIERFGDDSGNNGVHSQSRFLFVPHGRRGFDVGLERGLRRSRRRHGSG
jgi:hypothetical protein